MHAGGEPSIGIGKDVGLSMYPTSTASSFNLETYSTPDYGHQTWTTNQSVRDLLQNNLDAQTDIFYKKLATKVLLPEAQRGNFVEDENLKNQVENFCYQLFLYHKIRSSCWDEELAEFRATLDMYAKDLPIKSLYRTAEKIN